MKLLPSIFCMIVQLSGDPVHGQVNLQNTGTFYLTGNTDTLYINGSFTNTSTGAFTNNGRLYVKQNLTNDQSSVAVGTGVLYLNGSSAQSVNGSQPFTTFDLVTNNSAGIVLNNDLSVTGTHTFTSGLISSSATPNYLVYEAGSSYTGNSDTRHVDGWVKKLGNTNFNFPVGDASYERPVSISNLSATSEINCKYFRSTPNLYNLTSPLVAVDSNEYWQINKISGGTAEIGMNWNSAKVPFYNVLLTDITSAYYNGLSWISVGGTATGAPLTSGNITSSAVSSFGRFTFGYKSVPVPLKLISFTAERRAGATFLNWVTENEQYVDHFEAQRSDDATTYSLVGTKAGRNTSSQQQYSLEDHASLNRIAYYRIKSVDIDGKLSYSKVVAVSEREVQATNFIVLNPVHTAITISNKTGRDGSFDYRLFNAAGQTVLRGNTFMTNNGVAALQLPFSAAPGIYILELSNDNILYRQKIFVEK